ncbi:putative bifunctional diguanylate cyclase/phosphodiesterase [Kineosporia succinea]|uniref:Diguanylate cyclase (GGDEF)-like protein n=1 Tax=Kineosporia succinea TaxID=84632 RepID=A0ABT9PFR6_9ACTN|nr:bifunctional diguanylate cyclase/phosphodiesterase [Kineosporia succinea]MDP9831239.1 diguanylate cyclase (GGDEF)-like protein [Kineosporia succinea]
MGLLVLAVPAGHPDVQPWLLLAGTWVAVGATLGGIAWYRPAEWIAWSLVAGMLGLWGGAGLVGLLNEDAAAVGAALVIAGQMCAVGVVVRLFWIRRHGQQEAVGKARYVFFPGAVEEFGGRWDRFSRYADLLLLVGVFGVVVAQVVATVRALPTGVSVVAAVIPVIDVVLGGLLVRFLISRDRLPRSTFLGVLAAILTVVNDLVVVVGTGERAPLHNQFAQVAAVVAVGLFVWAPLEPSMHAAFSPQALLRRRSESSRLVALMPLAAVPVLLYVIGADLLPGLVYVLTGVLVAMVALVRGAAAVLDNERLADRDWYTGLLNRRGMVLAFRELAPTAESPWQLALLDVDDFKQVNDTFGHYAGDDLLVQIARRLRGQMSPDAILGRPGGDEFVLILPPGHTPVEAIKDKVFAAPFDVAGHEMPVRVSIGVIELNLPDRDEAEVFTEVDIAVYSAKAAGRNTVVVYDPKQRDQVLGRQALLTDLRRTLDGDVTAGTFEVYYQPLVELGTGLITGCEALMRWRHTERGMVRPDDFFGLAETSGLAGELDRWVLGEALAQVAAWEQEGIGSIYVSVNLGRTSMLDPRLAEATLQSLEHAGVKPTQLHLEITEHDELPPEAGALTLALLTEAGVRVSLDDFGIGYTSLDYLHRYPVRQLKLDRSITSNLQTDPSSPLLEGIVAMARSLKVDVVAEGIETEPQRERLAGLGIAYGQGYHLCRPQPAELMTDLLRQAGPAKRIPFPRPASDNTVVNLPA